MNQTDIKILKIVRVQGAGALRGFVDISLGDLIIRNWRIVQKPKERIQILYPQASYRDITGTIRYCALLVCPTEIKQCIDVEILSAWAERNKYGTNSFTATN